MTDYKIFNMGGFNMYSADQFMEYMLDVENSSQPYAIIHQTSGGGAVYALKKIYDCIKASNKKVVIVNSGISASCAAILFSVCDYRVTGESSEILIHEPSSMLWGTASEIESESKHIQDIKAWAFEVMDVHCGKEKGYFNDMSFSANNTDVRLNAQKCIEIGLADDIGALNSVLRMSDSEILEKCNKGR